MEKVILDTNILIEILKNDKQTISIVEQIENYCISEITKMELFYGALNKNELKKLHKFLSFFEIIPIEREISQKASELIYKYAKSHNLTIPDGLIAATSIVYDFKLLTYNIKDFKYIEELKLYKCY